MNNKVKIRVNNDSYKFFNFLIYNKVYYENLSIKNNKYELIVYYEDLDKFRRYEIEIIRYYGINGIINFIKYNVYVLIGLFCGLCVLLLLTNTIFSVQINTNDNDLLNKINKSLISNGITKYKKKRSFNEIKKIKDKILNENKDNIEWIEIIEDGCNYVIEVTKRVKGSEVLNDNYPSNIVASKDGLIMYISLINGVKVKDINDYVKKGEVIITGDIYKGDKLVNRVNAKGIVYAEVWYTTTVMIPFTYTEYVSTGKVINRYYIKMFDKEMTILGKYDSDNVMSEKTVILDKPYLPFDVYKEKMSLYEYKTFKITEKEAYNEALKRAEESIKKTLDDDEYIMYKKVLKKEVFSSKMILEVFYKVYENITSIKEIEEVNNDQ